ncbi:hypothetical protein GC173_18290 [bacterium]|nr:hypothetical protein [bacterium]
MNQESTLSREPFRTPWRVWLFLSILVVLLFTRLYDLGSKTMMHDELLFVHYTYAYLYKVWTYEYLPILHGPIMLLFQTLVFHLFGVSDYTARLGAALLGIGGFFFLWQLRHWMREPGTWFVLAFYALSPGITFFHRFFHQDAMYMFCTLWILASGANWWRTRNGWWMVSLLLAATSLFTNKASSIFVYFSIGTFIVLVILHDLSDYFLEGKSKDVPDYLERIPRVPSAWLFALGTFTLVTLIITQVFEGIVYDADVRTAIGHDWILRHVRSIPMAFGWYSLGQQQAAEAGVAGTGQFWRIFYLGLLLGSLTIFAALRIAILHRIGHREFLTGAWRRLYASRWYIGAGLGLSIFWYFWVYTTGFQHKIGFFEIYSRTWSYWGGQHEQGRIPGPFHQHGLNLLVYELPSVLLIVGAWLWSLFRLESRRSTGIAFLLMAVAVAAFHKLLFSGLYIQLPGTPEPTAAGIDWLKQIVLAALAIGAVIILTPRTVRVLAPAALLGLVVTSVLWLSSASWRAAFNAPIFKHGEAVHLAGRNVSLADFMEIQFNFDGGWNLLLVMILVFFATLYTWVSLARGARFRAFAVWWFVTMYGSAAYAREAVPQVGIHVMLPAIVLAGLIVNDIWEARRTLFAPRVLFWPVMGLFVLWNTKATINLNLYNASSPRERMAYGPASTDILNHMNFIRQYAGIAGIAKESDGLPSYAKVPNDIARHKNVRIYIGALDQVTWPAKWYLRDIAYTEGGNPETAIREGWEFIFIPVGDDTRYPDLQANYNIFRGRGTSFWTPSPISMTSLANIWEAAIPDHRTANTPLATEAETARADWYRIWRYLSHREIFDGTDRPYPSISSFEYLFCYRKDLL